MKSVTYTGKINNSVEQYTFNYDDTTEDNFPPNFFLNQKEIANYLYDHLTQEDKSTLAAYESSELPLLHHGYGMWIRNTFGLWCESNPHTKADDVHADNHPDQYSFGVIEELHRRVTYDRAMDILK